MKKHRIIKGISAMCGNPRNDLEDKIEALVEVGYVVQRVYVSDQYGYVAHLELEDNKYDIDKLKQVPHEESEEYLSNGYVLLSSSHVFSKFSVLARRRK